MPAVLKHRILLGSIGGDSHSVGLLVLRRALVDHGYDVRYLGTQNSLIDFFAEADDVDLVMMSCMDGHALHYLREFPHLVARSPLDVPWYLGGNPVVDSSSSAHRRFVEMGFRRVFLQFVEFDTVLEAVAKDLAAVPFRYIVPVERHAAVLHAVDVQDERLADDDFFRERGSVLQHWSTGPAAADLRDNASVLAARPSVARAQARVLSGSERTLVQPRSGVALEAEQAKMFQVFRKAGCPVLSYQVDSMTRNNRYADAADALMESRMAGTSTINGFPLVNHGVAVLRRIGASVDAALQVRHSTRDPRLLAEIAYAGGVSAFEGGAISYNLPYYRDYPLGEAIRNWQYVDRLTGVYAAQFGVILDREFFGVLTATLIPPSLAIATGILEGLLALRQGVRCISIGYAEQGNRAQDVAAVESIVPLATEVFAELGFRSVQVNAIYHQYMAAFPPYASHARAMIRASATTAGMARATRMLTKTSQEAINIPSVADNLEGVSLARRGLDDAAEFDPTGIAASVEEERRWIRRETMALVEATLALGDDDVAKGVVLAFERGVLDVPFSPSIHVRHAVSTVRDTSGAVRYLDAGHLPFDREIVEFHQERIRDRRRAEGTSREQDYRLVEQDVLRVARGQFTGWPLG